MAARVQGEVYQAKDTRLERTVAIKILPEHLADNAERKERFERYSSVAFLVILAQSETSVSTLSSLR